MVLSRGIPLFLTQIEWDLTLILTSLSLKKVRKVSSFGHYMYSEHIRVVEIEKERIWIFIAETYALNVHPRLLSIMFVSWSSQLVLFCFVFLDCLLSFFLLFCHDCHTCAFIFGCSFQFCAFWITTLQFNLCQWIVNLMRLSSSVSLIFCRGFLLCTSDILWVTFQFSSSL